jgi:hypothetical protein
VSKIKIIAGDLELGTYDAPNDLFGREIIIRKQFSMGKIDLAKELERVELHSEESVKRLAGTTGWGLAGLAVFGPLGAIGGMLIGGKDKDICFAGYLKDGRKFLATTDNKTYKKISASVF